MVVLVLIIGTSISTLLPARATAYSPRLLIIIVRGSRQRAHGRLDRRVPFPLPFAHTRNRRFSAYIHTTTTLASQRRSRSYHPDPDPASAQHALDRREHERCLGELKRVLVLVIRIRREEWAIVRRERRRAQQESGRVSAP